MARVLQKMTIMNLRIPEKARETLARQAKSRGVSLELWAGQVFDAGFAAICAKEKSLPVSDGDLDAIVGAALLLRAQDHWDTASIAKSLGVSEPTIVRVFEGWKTYRVGQE